MNNRLEFHGTMIMAIKKSATDREVTWRVLVKSPTGEWKAETTFRDALRWVQIAITFDSRKDKALTLYLDGKLAVLSGPRKDRADPDGKLYKLQNLKILF